LLRKDDTMVDSLARWRFVDWSLRTKVIVASVSMCALLAVSLTVIAYNRASHGLQQQAGTALNADAQLMTLRLHEYDAERISDVQRLAGMAALARMLTSTAAMQPSDVAAVEEAMTGLMRAVPGVENVVLVNAQGQTTFAGTPAQFVDLSKTPFDVSATPTFQQAMRGAIPDPSISLSSGAPEPEIFISVPVRDPSGTIVGVIVEGLDATTVSAMVAAAGNRLGQGAQGILLDAAGLVVASSVSPAWTLHPVVALPAALAAALQQGMHWDAGQAPPPLRQPDLASIVGVKAPRLFTWHNGATIYRAVAAPVAGTDWTYVSALPVSVIQQPVQTFLREASIAAGIALALAVLVALAVSWPIALAAERLAAFARTVASGDLRGNTGVHARDELGRVALAFDDVIAAQRELARSADAVAQGDLSIEVRPRSAEDTLGHAFRTMVENLRTLMEQLRRSASYDPLTNLPNRFLFSERLQAALTLRPQTDAAVIVLFIDLDGFKVVNDSLGHALGDRLLSDVAARMTACLRSTDILARFGGDEFALLLVGGSDLPRAQRIAARILASLQQPLRLAHRDVCVSASIGIAAAQTDEDRTGEDLLRRADIAMYRAKATGRARSVVFDQGTDAAAEQRLDLEMDLRAALEQGELRVYYQPLVAQDSLAVVGVEALVRWEHPERGLIAPAAFIPIAEETGLIVALGHFVLKAACAQLRAWDQLAMQMPPLTINVNLSARELAAPDLVATVVEALAETGLAPERLCLEITESVLV
jgi:diguanylate cyclase (GGDEF)-like protein